MKKIIVVLLLSTLVRMQADQEVDIVIIGSGPAGVAAGMHASDLLRTSGTSTPVLVITGEEPGGLLTHASMVQNCPGIPSAPGVQLMETMIAQAKNHGAAFLEDEVTRVNFSVYPFVIETQNSGIIVARSVIVATGTSPRKLGVPGEQYYWEKGGVSACALCDAFAYQGKVVAVIGGGDAAVDQAAHLAQYAAKVYVLVRSKSMRAKACMQEMLTKTADNVQLLYNKSVLEIEGDGENVTGLKLFDREAQREETLPVDGVFLAIGHQANTDLVKEYLELSSSGRIVVSPETRETTMPGVFAAGDVVFNEYRQVPVAIGSAVIAARNAVEWLRYRFIPVEER